MSDPFNILGDFDESAPRRFEDAAREAVEKFMTSVERFEELYERVPAEKFTEDEWRLVELAAKDVEEAVERAEEGYVAVQYDSHAWYRILENLEKIHLRLESTTGLMQRVRDRDA
jgi:hypothetical protein